MDLTPNTEWFREHILERFLRYVRFDTTSDRHSLNVPSTPGQRVFAEALLEEIMFGNLGFWELLIIFVIVILIFGTSRIPELGRGLGEGIRNFKKSLKGDDEEKAKKQP